MEYLHGKAGHRECNQYNRKNYVAVNKMKGAGDLKSVSTSDMVMQSLEFAQLVSGFVLLFPH